MVYSLTLKKTFRSRNLLRTDSIESFIISLVSSIAYTGLVFEYLKNSSCCNVSRDVIDHGSRLRRSRTRVRVISSSRSRRHIIPALLQLRSAHLSRLADYAYRNFASRDIIWLLFGTFNLRSEQKATALSIVTHHGFLFSSMF